MSDSETPGDGGSGESQDQQDLVSMEQLNEAVQSAVSETVEAFKPLLTEAQEEQTKRIQQSQRDAIKDRVGRSVASALEAAGVSTAPASEDEGRGNADASHSDPAPESDPTDTDPLALEMQAILEDAGIDGSQPEFQELLKANAGKPWYQWGSEFAELAQSIGERDSSGPIGGGEGGPSPSSDLEAEYIEAVNDLYRQRREGALNSTDSRIALRQLKEDYSKKGVEVDQIGFGIAGVYGR